MIADPDRPPLPLESEPRRHLTILFTDLSDSTRLSALLEAEVYAELQDDVRLAFRSVVGKYKGTLNQFQGDGLQALFGNPHPSEHDGQRATEAALEVHERVRALRAKYAMHGASDLAVHSGIHAGLILLREGDAMAGRFEIFGATPGIAKHLSDVADRDEILVSEETLGPGSYLFQTSERRRVRLKGREEPLAIHRILARSSLRTRFQAHAQRGLAPFVGRSAELAQLEAALHRVGEGRLQFVAISASAGLGKTRLAEEFLRRAAESGCAVSRGYCESDLSAEPLQPFLQMLRSRFGLLPGTGASAASASIERGLADIDAGLLRHSAELLQVLSIPPDVAAGAGLRRLAPEQAIHVLCNLFAALAHGQPQILFIDDWQWADDATREVVYAIRELAMLPILLLVTTRPFELGDAELTAAEVVKLGPFTDAEAARTIGELLPSVDPFVAGEIRRYSGGNPLFIEELCHSAASGSANAGFDPVRGGSAWLETLIESRVARLTREQAGILSAAAVIGNVVPTWLLQSLTGCDARHPLVQDLAVHDLVFPGDSSATLRFKHGITRDVVYGAVGLQKRRTMHQAIARLIRSRGEPGAEVEACEALAYHHAGAAEFDEAARFAEMAGDKATAASSIDRAKTQYRAALEMLDRLAPSPERYQAWRSVVRRLGLATVYDPSRNELELFARAVVRARDNGDAAGLAYAEYWLAYINYALGESRAAVAHCELALQAATASGDVRLVPQVRATLGQALAAASDYPTALRLLDDAAGLARGHAGSARPAAGAAYTLACKASVLGDLGQFADALGCIDDALALVPARGHEVEGSVLCWRSQIHLWMGRWEEARADAHAAHRIAERVRSLYLFATSHGLGAYADWKLEATARPLRDMADAVTWLESRDKNLFVSLSYGRLAEVMTAQGHVAAARAYAACALRRARKRDWIGVAMAARAMVGMAAGQGDWRAAERHLALATRAAQLRGAPHEAAHNDICSAQLALARGQREAAAVFLARAIDTFGRLRMEWHRAQAEALRRRC